MQNRIPPHEDTIDFVALLTNRERYIIFYDAEHIVEAKRTLGRWASHPELSFTWCNAADLCAKVGQIDRQDRQDALIARRPR